MFDLLATVLAWFYEIVPNYAVAIAMLTFCVMVLVTPLTLRATKSMLQMQKLQPELKRIQQEFKGDRQAMNEELMKFYQANKINPLGGCLPILLQSPVFFVLYRVLHKLTETCSEEQIAKALAGDGNTRCLLADGTPVPPGTFGPSYLDKSTQLFQDLAGQTKMLAFGLDLSHSAVRELGDSVVGGLPYLVLVLLVTATSYVQQWQISLRTAKQGTPVNPQQQMLLRILPGFFAVISLTLPAGLVVYFLVSNTYRIAQQEYITRRFYKEGQAAAAAAAGGGDGDADEDQSPKKRRGGGDGGTAKPAPSKTPKSTGSNGGAGKAGSAKPTPSKQASAKQASAKQAASKPAPSKPAPSKPGATKPATGAPPAGKGKGTGPGRRPQPNRPAPRKDGPGR